LTISPDIRAGETDAQLVNWLHAGIAMVAGLFDHLKKVGDGNGKLP
jgi:hypothetical protein